MKEAAPGPAGGGTVDALAPRAVAAGVGGDIGAQFQQGDTALKLGALNRVFDLGEGGAVGLDLLPQLEFFGQEACIGHHPVQHVVAPPGRQVGGKFGGQLMRGILGSLFK